MDELKINADSSLCTIFVDRNTLKTLKQRRGKRFLISDQNKMNTEFALNKHFVKQLYHMDIKVKQKQANEK